MPKLRLLRVRHSTAVAYLALFVALGGTSYAAIKLPGNSVGAKQIKGSAVGSAEVRDSSLRSRDFAPGLDLRGATGAAGPVGPAGAPGAAGTARAYARLLAGTCDIGTGVCPLDKATGVTAMRRVAVGRYCITAPGISSSTTPASVTVDYFYTATPESLAEALLADGSSGCSDGEFGVNTKRPSNFSGDAFVNNVSFTIVIP